MKFNRFKTTTKCFQLQVSLLRKSTAARIHLSKQKESAV